MNPFKLNQLDDTSSATYFGWYIFCDQQHLLIYFYHASPILWRSARAPPPNSPNTRLQNRIFNLHHLEPRTPSPGRAIYPHKVGACWSLVESSIPKRSLLLHTTAHSQQLLAQPWDPHFDHSKFAVSAPPAMISSERIPKNPASHLYTKLLLNSCWFHFCKHCCLEFWKTMPLRLWRCKHLDASKAETSRPAQL